MVDDPKPVQNLILGNQVPLFCQASDSTEKIPGERIPQTNDVSTEKIPRTERNASSDSTERSLPQNDTHVSEATRERR